MSINALMSRQCESFGGLMFIPQQFPDELNHFESEVVSKIDNIINILHELEDQFTQARHEVIRKSSLEGKESDKICAIKGRVISNKKKYYRNLEGDISSLDKTFQEQFTKISKDLLELKVISGIEEKVEPEKLGKETITTYTLMPSTGNYEENFQEIVGSSPYVKSVAVPSIKKLDSGTKPISIGRPVARPLFKANSTTEVELPRRKLEFDKTENIPNPSATREQRRLANVQSETSNIPEDNEEDINEAVSNIRLELLNEMKNIQVPKKKKPMRYGKAHGFRLSQTSSEVSTGRDLLMELPPFDYQ